MLPESKDKADSVTTDEENKREAQSHSGSGNKKQVMNKSQRQDKTQESSEESTDEEENGIGTGKNSGDSPEEVEKRKANTLKDSGTARKIPSHEKETNQSDEDSDGDEGDDMSEKSEKIKNMSSDDSDKGDGPSLMPI